MTGSEKTLSNAHMAQCAFLASTVKKYQSPIFVIFMSKNPSTNCCHRLRRVNVSYQSKISLHFNLPSQYSCRTRSLLLWALIRISYLGTARFIELAHLLSFLGIEEQSPTIVNIEIRPLLDLYIHFERLRPGPFN